MHDVQVDTGNGPGVLSPDGGVGAHGRGWRGGGGEARGGGEGLPCIV